MNRDENPEDIATSMLIFLSFIFVCVWFGMLGFIYLLITAAKG